MEGKNGKNPIIALTVATVFFAALGVIVYTQAPYRGVRPSVPEIREPSEKIRARLWQEPFQAVLDHVKAREERRKGMVALKHDDTVSGGKQAPDQETLTKHDPIVAGVIDLEKCNPAGALKGVISGHKQQGRKIIVLGAMVWGGPHAELVEARIRQRYAVLSALNRLQYYPVDPEHIGCLKILNRREGQDTLSPWDQEFTLTNIVPFEWLVSDEGKKPQESILLLWLNEDSFTYNNDPLAKLIRLKKHFPQQDIEKFILLGPPSSTTLLAMIRELDSPEIEKVECHPGLEIYCATATADDTYLLKGFKYKKKVISEQRAEAREEIFNKFLTKGIYFTRPICSDGELIEELIEELDRRDVDLINPKTTLFQRVCGVVSPLKSIACEENRDHIVLVSEWDTDYGRLLPKTFLEVIKEKHNNTLAGKNIEVEDINWVHRFSYLRGMDGKLPGEQNGNAKGGKKDDAGSKKEDDLKRLEEPLGKSQYDYLRRLAENICRLDDKLNREGKGSIKAIGVLGNDFYDKFPVLQALGQRLPDRIFFTTDLDALYLHPANIKWTRNLVVASSFGLQLHEKLQVDVPPFRDVYQTAVFAATLRAFDYRPLIINEFQDLKPRIFEIGRRNAIDLTGWSQKPAINQALPVHGFPEIGWFNFAILIVVISILAMLLWLSCTSDTGMWHSIGQFFKTNITLPYINKPIKIIYIWLICFAILTLFLLSFYFLIITNPFEEPFYLAEGMSIWPTEIIRLAAFLLSLIFITYSWKSLEDNKLEIDQDFYLDEKYKAQSKISWSRIDIRENAIDVNEQWKEYVNLTAGKKRIGWILLIVFIYMIFCFLIINTFGIPSNPVRGDWSRGINIGILFLAVISFLFLTFFVLDTTMMFRRFVRQFSHKQPQWHLYSLDLFLQKWIKNAEHSKWIGSRTEAPLSDWMLIQLIAKRTEVVGKLIYFPFIIWVLLFVSRLHYFDNWRTPLGLAIVISMGALLAWSCTIILRRSAEKLRTEVMDRLAQQVIGAYSAEPPDENDGERIKYVLQEIKTIHKGAFAPFLQQPALQSLLVPFAGIGGANLLDLFM